jgi:hypothetical protein
MERELQADAEPLEGLAHAATRECIGELGHVVVWIGQWVCIEDVSAHDYCVHDVQDVDLGDVSHP